MLETRQPLPAGYTLLGRFEIATDTQDIALGGFGITYRARDLSRGGAPVALKEYFPAAERGSPGEAARKRGDDGVTMEPALNEHMVNAVLAEAMAQLATERHPAIAPVVLAFRGNGTAYVAMDWVDGSTLWGCMDSLAYDDAHLRKIYLTLLDALLFIGKQGLSHGDLSVRNIMIRSSDREPVLIDFGASRSTGDGYVFATSAPAGTPGFIPPELLTGQGHHGIWTDLFGLSASLYYFLCGEPPLPEHPELYAAGPRASLVERKTRGEHRLAACSDALLAVIDHGLASRIEDRQRVPAEVLGILGVSADELCQILHPEVFSRTSLLDPPRPRAPLISGRHRPAVSDADLVKHHGYQRTLLQSFDAARFQKTSIKRHDDQPLTVDPEVKIALSRTEALLAVAFGREIVMPAGHVADSPAFQAIFTEIAAPYQRLAGSIATACAKERMPVWAPFRLGLERRDYRDYLGFLKTYQFTGAPLVILEAAGKNISDELAKQQLFAQGLKQLIEMFEKGRFHDLEQALQRPGYAEFSRLARSYFRDDKSVFAAGDADSIASTDYANVFRRHLTDERAVGAGVAEARQSLAVVDRIERVLAQHHHLGLRGNWYEFASEFHDVWQLARAYLDTRLFVSLARQYRIDHPVFITQEFEYGKFDHSLIFGPKIAAELTTGRYDDARLIRLATHFARPIAWHGVLELYTQPTFLRSIRRMNRALYLGDQTDYSDYFDAVESHSILLDKWLGYMLAIDLSRGRFVIRARTQADGEGLALDGYEMILADGVEGEAARQCAESALASYGGALPDERAGVRVLHTLADGNPATGGEMKDAVLHYFLKPYRMLTSGRGPA